MPEIDRKENKERNSLDPVTVQVIAGALENIAVEMGHKLARMAHSSIIRESEDYGAALLDARGQQLCESKQSTPLQLGPIPGYVKGIIKLFKERDQKFFEGDVIIHNSAYYGASHGPDIAFCLPIFWGKRGLVGYAVTTAHHLDVGALVPGSSGIVNAVDAYAEGLQFKAIKVYEKGVRQEQVWNIIADNIRVSEFVVADMEAQIAACRIGAKRFLSLNETYGFDTVLAASEEMINYSERMLRQSIESLPDGNYYAENYFDGYLDSPDPAKRDLKIAVRLKIEGSDIFVNFTGTSPQLDDCPINMPFEGTVQMAVNLTLRSILLDSAIFDYVPQNAGLTRPIHIFAPEGSMVNPIFPAPTIARFCPGNVVADTVMKALSQICPKQVSAGTGASKVIVYSGLRSNREYWVYMDITEGSYGGRYGKDGIDAVDTLFVNTRNNPIEDIETHYPLRVTRYELRDDSAGYGKWRGGIGAIRDIMFLEEGRVGVEGEGNKYPPWGVEGGLPGNPGDVVFNPGKPEEQHLPSKFSDRKSKAGDTYRTVGPCGGGYGTPRERDPSDITSDILDGFISQKEAFEVYGVEVGRKPNSTAGKSL
jgi:N-methylhydantoinase B